MVRAARCGVVCSAVIFLSVFLVLLGSRPRPPVHGREGSGAAHRLRGGALAAGAARARSAGVSLPRGLALFPGKGVSLAGCCLPADVLGQDRTLSPYFFVAGGGGVDSFPLKETRVEADIAGVIADVRVTQFYENCGREPIEATYVFPASTRAAVHALRMIVGRRVVEAQIRTREKARQEYEAARDGGQRAALLEQERPNVFRMSVANIMPGETVQVELRYVEALEPENGVYQFVYPTVVGPRYDNRTATQAPGDASWVETPYLHSGVPPASALAMEVHLSAGMAIRELTCPSHAVQVAGTGPEAVDVTLDASERSGGNRDFILDYRLAGDDPCPGLLLYEGEGTGENYFLYMVQPPVRVADRPLPPREYLFIVDVSGSMCGFPLDTAKQLLAGLLKNLRSCDRFNVELFSGGSSFLADKAIPARKENIDHACGFIERNEGGGGTEIVPALEAAFALPRAPGAARTVVVVTDGYVTADREVYALIRRHLGRDNVFAFGIGQNVNRNLIEGLARAGGGRPFVVTGPQEAEAKVKAFADMIRYPLLTGLRLEFEGFGAYDLDPPSPPDLYAGLPLVVSGKWRGPCAGRIVLSGHSDRAFRSALEVGRHVPAEANAALPMLWARRRIASLADEAALAATPELEAQITVLGLKYGLLTEYTSFVAVDQVPTGCIGRPWSVKQPLPLPRGVPDTAVGGVPPGAPANGGGPSMACQSEQASGCGVIASKCAGAPAGASKPASHAPGQPVAVGGNVLSSKLASRVEPVYPDLARRARLQGTVILRITVDTAGRVAEARVVSGHPLLSTAAVEAVKKWRYTPVVLNGRPVKTEGTVMLNFHLTAPARGTDPSTPAGRVEQFVRSWRLPGFPRAKILVARFLVAESSGTVGRPDGRTGGASGNPPDQPRVRYLGVQADLDWASRAGLDKVLGEKADELGRFLAAGWRNDAPETGTGLTGLIRLVPWAWAAGSRGRVLVIRLAVDPSGSVREVLATLS